MNPPLWANVVPQSQHTPVSCGQTSVAMAINALTGKSLTDHDIAARYGFALLAALNGETGPKYVWRDDGNFAPSMWPALEHLTRNGFPFVIGLNGEFSVTGRGHIVLVHRIEGDAVTFADPAEGIDRTVSKARIEHGQGYPQGDFVFVCSKP